MVAFRTSPVPDAQAEPARPEARLAPSEYGTLGPGSDFNPNPEAAAGPRPANARTFGPIVGAAIGVLFAVLVGSIGSAHAAWGRFAHILSPRRDEVSSAPGLPPGAKDARQLDRLQPQTQAEILLEQAVGHSDVAVDQISSRVDRWQGKLKWNPQIATLTTAALNSSNLRVRESGIEVELAAYGLAKNSASLDYLLTTAASNDHAQKIWALWALGLMANRGVATDRIVQFLTAQVKDSDEDSRHWAVEGLALAGTKETIEPLLQALHSDSSPTVRESAACSLAESGMFTHEQRLAAVPQLLAFTDDPALDSRTHAWTFRALTDITGQHLPNDSSVWRNWYESNKTD
jgi:HEAT repeats